MPSVNGEILRWARETAGLTPEQAVVKLQLTAARGVEAVERLRRLEENEESPTRPMLVKMAKQYRRPLVTFYMTAPPRRGIEDRTFAPCPKTSPLRTTPYLTFSFATFARANA